MRVKQLERFVSALFVLLILGLVYLQILKGEEYRKQSEENVIRLIPIPAPRGEIVDRNGAILADYRLVFEVTVIPQETKNLASLVRTLSEILTIDSETLLRNYSRNFSTPFMPVVILEDIEKEKALMLAERRDLPGVGIRVTPRRHYPHGPATVHLLGVLGEISPSELRRLRPYGYGLKDLLGRGGIEEAFDNYLRGEEGGTQLKVDHRGHRVATLGHRPPRKGTDLALTIDVRLQNHIHSLLEGKRGAVCVMDPKTGEVLALVSSPSFDPNQDFSELLEAEGNPFLNRVLQGRYPPGSTFKIVVAASALEENQIRSGSTFHCPGYFRLGNESFQCWLERGHGEENVTTGLKHSCNVFFYRTGLSAGAEKIARTARLFGFGEKSGIALPHETGGFVPTPLWKRLTQGEGWYDGDTVNFSIGQGFLSVTPLQLLRMASVIAAEGKLVEPQVVKRIGPHPSKGSKTKVLPLSPKTLSLIREGMVEVVGAPDGTGRLAAVPGLEIAGKTGTAQVRGKEPHAWFVGFSPARNPAMSLVVLVEHGGMGGVAASQIAASIFRKMAELELI